MKGRGGRTDLEDGDGPPLAFGIPKSCHPPLSGEKAGSLSEGRPSAWGTGMGG